MMHKRTLMIAGAVVSVMLSSCSSVPSLSSLTWKYQQTADKKVELGRRDNSLSIQTEGVIVRFDAPKGWRVVSCVDESFTWHYVASAPDATIAFGVKVVRFPDNPPLETRYENYLEGLRRAYDPGIQMAASQPFTVGGKKLPSYQYFSPTWGQRLVVMVPSGGITTVFEFKLSTPSTTVFTAGHEYIQKILSTYSLRKL